MSAASMETKGAISLREFADLHGLTMRQTIYALRCGRVVGAQRTHGGKWLVFPPATLAESHNFRAAKSGTRAHASVAEVPAAGVGTQRSGASSAPHACAGSGLEARQVARRPRTPHGIWDAGPSLLTGLPSYYADPYLQCAARRIKAALEAVKRGAARLMPARTDDDDWGLP